MKINTKIVIDIATYEVLERENFEYPDGCPIAQCCGGGPGGGGVGGSAAAAAGHGSGGVPGAEAGYGGSAGQPGMGTPGIGAPGIGAPGGPGVAGPSGGGFGFDVTNALETFGLVTGVTGNPAAGVVAGGIVGVATGSDFGDISGDMAGDLTGGNTIGGPDTASKAKTRRATIKGIADEDARPTVLADIKKDDEEKKVRKRPQTILTSPLGLRSRATIRRATLLGG